MTTIVWDARRQYEAGLLTLCEARHWDTSIEPERSVWDCRCEFGAINKLHISQETEAVLADVETAIRNIRTLGGSEGVLTDDTLLVMGAIEHNLYTVRKDQSIEALFRAVYCLGKLNDRMLTRAGDVEGYRCKDREMRGEMRQYAEVARELAQTLPTVAASLR